ncbi:MAG: DHH family phosphoesterase [Candidatus Microsaccharimonas sp.]
MFDTAIKLINDAKKIVVIQAENPDGDSLGSALAFEEILSDLGKDVVLYCAIDIPKYMHYIKGWDRVVRDWPTDRDLAIIVDTTSQLLMAKALEVAGVRHFLETHPVLVIDHHQETEPDLPFEATIINDIEAVASSEAIYKMTQDAGWKINQQAAENMFLSIQADSLGLTTQNTTAASYRIAAELVALGASPSEIEQRRREYMKKPADILAYKGELIGRIEYNLDGKLATVLIPWADIEQYSDRYNPSVLVLDEMRLVDHVQIAVAIKTYPDGKLTGKIRSNIPIAGTVAGFFGGGGHEYSSGFKVYENYDKIMPELVTAVDKALTDYDDSIS